MPGTFLSMFLLLSLGQQLPPSGSDDEPGFRIGVDVDQVFLSVNARSTDGGFVKDLGPEDFQIFEDGVPQTIVNFYREAVPIQLVLLVDISGSTREFQGSIRRAAMELVRNLSPRDRVAVVTFSDAARLILDWTSDRDRIENAIHSVYAKGITVMNDALFVTFDDLLADVEGRKAVVLLTDGVDTGSMVDFEHAFDRGVRSEAIVYVVSLLDLYWVEAMGYRMEMQRRSMRVPRPLTDAYIIETKRSLERLARQTGGKVLEADVGNLQEKYAQVAEELRHQYYISYRPSNILADGTWRNIEIRVNRPGVAVSTRPGYYAPREEVAHSDPR